MSLLRKKCCCTPVGPPVDCSGCAACAGTIAWTLSAVVQTDYTNGNQTLWTWEASGTMARVGNGCLWSPVGLPMSYVADHFAFVDGTTVAGSCEGTVVPEFDTTSALGGPSCSVFPFGVDPPPSSPTPTYWRASLNAPSGAYEGGCTIDWPGGNVPSPVLLRFSRPSLCPTQAVLQWVRVNGCWIALPGGGQGSCTQGGITSFVDIQVTFT